MKVLVACEYSAIVRDAFRARGHDAWSNDIIDCEGDSAYHIKGDALDLLKDGWDLLIAHPPCTYLANSSVRWLYDKRPSTKDCLRGIDRWKAMYEGSMFFRAFLEAPIGMICVENPVPHKFARGYIGEYTQTIQPYQFGHLESKRTCLWLRGLPQLMRTDDRTEEAMALPYGERCKTHYKGKSKDRGKDRSKFFTGFAEAMATQWG